MKIKGAFVGETVSAKAFEIRADRAKGRYQSVVEKAIYSVDPICAHFGKCGGCISQQIPLEKQRAFKEEVVLLLFKNNGIDPGNYLGIAGDDTQYKYRNKMEYTFGDEVKDVELNLCMHFRGLNP